MKLSYRDIADYASRSPSSPVVLIYGPDHGLVRERALMLAGHIVPSIDDPFNVSVLSGAQLAEDPARLKDEAAAISMMGGNRLVWVRDAVDSIHATIKNYLSSPADQAFVLIEAGELGKNSPLRKTIESAPNAVALPCYVQDADDLARTITRIVQSAHVQIDRDAVHFLAQAIGGDHQQVKSELEKLLTYMGVSSEGKGSGVTITLDDVMSCSGTMGLAGIDGFVDAVFLGEAGTALILFERLKDEDGFPLALLRALLAHGRKIQTTQKRIARGERLDDILDPKRNPPVFFKRKAAFTSHLRTWTDVRLERFMNDVFMAEMKLKSNETFPAQLPQTLLALSARGR